MTGLRDQVYRSATWYYIILSDQTGLGPTLSASEVLLGCLMPHPLQRRNFLPCLYSRSQTFVQIWNEDNIVLVSRSEQIHYNPSEASDKVTDVQQKSYWGIRRVNPAWKT